MAKIISLDISTPDTEADLRSLESLQADLERCIERDPAGEMVPILRNAVVCKQVNIAQHRSRLNKMHRLVEEGHVVGWQAVQVILFEDKECRDQFRNVSVSKVFDSYSSLKAHLADYLAVNFPEYRQEGLVSSAAFFSGDAEEFGRFYGVNDYTDLGHDWGIPLLRYRLVDGGSYCEVYAHAITK